MKRILLTPDTADTLARLIFIFAAPRRQKGVSTESRKEMEEMELEVLALAAGREDGEVFLYAGDSLLLTEVMDRAMYVFETFEHTYTSEEKDLDPRYGKLARLIEAMQDESAVAAWEAAESH